MSNINLSANINVRTTLDIKKKLMDESDKREMTMSEYVLFILETHWSKVNAPQEENNEILRLYEELAEVRKTLLETQSKVVELRGENSQLIERLSEEPKTVWQEAVEATDKLSEDNIQKRIDIALNLYRQQLREEIVINENQQINSLLYRIQLYETPLLQGIFRTLSAKNLNIRDMPDVVAVLTQHYYQEIIVPNQIQTYQHEQ
jgi:regulator of replication initiation timing